jgi:UPF0755 protein
MKKFLISIILILILGFLVVGFYFPKSPLSGEEVIFKVEKGEGSREISLNLENEGLIRWAPFFRVYVLITRVAGNLQAGKYVLSPSMSISEIAAKLAQGEVIKEKITIIEGWDLRDIGFYFENKGMFQAEELWELAGFPVFDYKKATGLPFPEDFSQDFSFLKDKPENLGLEGYLFPDTYEISQGESLEEIVNRMLSNFGEKLSLELRAEIARQRKTIFEIVTMASLIEKEVETKEDRELVSGIFWKRIELGGSLDSCATIAYLMGRTDWTFEEMREEIAEGKKIDSPYNTYMYPGLPFGPICNPGLESIMAAIYPKASQYWYYLSTPEGETIFSKTLEEHNIAKAKYY